MGYQRRNGPIDYKGYGKNKNKNTISLVRVVGVAVFVLVVVWVLLQLFGSGGEIALKKEQASIDGSFLDRKNVYDRNLQSLAVSFCQYAAYVKPLEVEKKVETAQVLADLLGLDEQGLLARLNTERTFIWLGQQLQSEQASQILERKIAGVYLQEKPVRYYPHGQTMAQMLGYVKDGKGLAGVELYYDGVLTGGVGQVGPTHSSRPVFETGKHVVLTIDLKIQTQLEKAMVQLLKKTEATSVSAMLVHTESGAILASVQLPSFDPNTFWDGHPQTKQLNMVSSLIDTGGVSSLFRYAAAVDVGRPLYSNVNHYESPVVLKPSLMKTGDRSRAGYWWPWAGGGFVSDELTELPDPTITASELLRFQQKLGITCADNFDYPDTPIIHGKCEEGKLNGISLLGGFTRLVNGGKPVYLHSMKGTVTSDGQFAAYDFATQGEELGGVSGMLSQSFVASAGDDAPLFAVEYLSKRALDDAVTVETATLDGKNQVSVLQKEYRHDGLLLGAIPAKNPQVTILIVVEEGMFDLRSASPLRNTLNRFAQGVDLDGLDDSSLVEQSIVDSAVLKSKFAGMKRSGLPTVEQQVSTAVRFMPELRGKSLRKALILLQPYMVTVDINGAGRVMAQNPEPGSEMAGHVSLTLGKQE